MTVPAAFVELVDSVPTPNAFVKFVNCVPAVVSLVLAVGCYDSHGRGAGPADGGTSLFEGRWLVDQPEHALYEATIYELAPGGRLVEVCSFSAGGPVPTGTVRRDGVECTFVGPWSSRHEGELAIDAFCSDSVQRTVVLDVAWGDDSPTSVTVAKVDGEEGWSHGPFAWRWLPCEVDPEACDVCP
ncbi:MAG TPA: hypothetical protein RMH99_10010 [Sandaracinaceae bacterium LLY-WYZ-13_1]|nr:hypothetical protein [Sandaracinaceae bacterium LLY-WYZ-13_1]